MKLLGLQGLLNFSYHDYMCDCHSMLFLDCRPLDRIVLVHYREVKENHWDNIITYWPHGNLLAAAFDEQSAFHSSQMNVRRNEQMPSSVFDTENTIHHPALSSFGQSAYASNYCEHSSGQPEISGSLEISQNHHESDVSDSQGISSRLSPNRYCPYHAEAKVGDPKCSFKQPNGGEGDCKPKIKDVKSDAGTTVRDMTLGYELKSDVDTHVLKEFQGKNYSSNETELPNYLDLRAVSSTGQVNNSPPYKEAADNCTKGELQKLDSFGRWMNNEIGKDCDDSLMVSDSGKYWNSLDNENEGSEASSLLHHMQLDVDSLSQEQLFTICDFSPDWAYSGTDTKVLITGTFLVNPMHSSGMKWSCMFGEIEVCAEQLTDHVLRCQAPSHAPGHVPFYVTCGNRLACSQIREFEFREKPNKPLSAIFEDEVHIQVRLAKVLCSVKASKWPDCSSEACDKCRIKQVLLSMWIDKQNEWKNVDEIISSRGNCNSGLLMQRLLEDRLYEWLIFKLHEGGTGLHHLDKFGQGVIHLASALGYEWGIRLIIAAGISPNFRDARGRTALYWASYYGREDAIIALVKFGAAAEAVNNPTPALPERVRAADLASSRGHKGIAGY
ncbi:hypothetical protein QQ045_028763 [Rhodiola kirilowii]